MREDETMIVVTMAGRQGARIGCAITGESQIEFASRVLIEAAARETQRRPVKVTLPAKQKRGKR